MCAVPLTHTTCYKKTGIQDDKLASLSAHHCRLVYHSRYVGTVQQRHARVVERPRKKTLAFELQVSEIVNRTDVVALSLLPRYVRIDADSSFW